MMGERSLLVVAILSHFPHWRGGLAMPVGGCSACSFHEPDAKGQPVGPSSVQRPISAIYRKDETWVSGDMPEVKDENCGTGRAPGRQATCHSPAGTRRRDFTRLAPAPVRFRRPRLPPGPDP